jgi:hypothetical protein
MTSKIKINKRQLITIIIVVVLFVCFLIFVLEKTQVTSFYSKPVKIASTSTDTRPINDVQYTPATSTEQDEGQQIKQNLIDQANNPQKPTAKIGISLSAANQDIPGGPLIIRSLVNAKSGTCKLTVASGSTVKTYSSEVVSLGTYYSCQGFDIPISDISDGKWQIKLYVSNTSASGEVTQEVEIKS